MNYLLISIYLLSTLHQLLVLSILILYPLLYFLHCKMYTNFIFILKGFILNPINCLADVNFLFSFIYLLNIHAVKLIILILSFQRVYCRLFLCFQRNCRCSLNLQKKYFFQIFFYQLFISKLALVTFKLRNFQFDLLIVKLFL